MYEDCVYLTIMRETNATMHRRVFAFVLRFRVIDTFQLTSECLGSRMVNSYEEAIRAEKYGDGRREKK